MDPWPPRSAVHLKHGPFFRNRPGVSTAEVHEGRLRPALSTSSLLFAGLVLSLNFARNVVDRYIDIVHLHDNIVWSDLATKIGGTLAPPRVQCSDQDIPMSRASLPAVFDCCLGRFITLCTVCRVERILRPGRGTVQDAVVLYLLLCLAVERIRVHKFRL